MTTTTTTTDHQEPTPSLIISSRGGSCDEENQLLALVHNNHNRENDDNDENDMPIKEIETTKDHNHHHRRLSSSFSLYGTFLFNKMKQQHQHNQQRSSSFSSEQQQERLSSTDIENDNDTHSLRSIVSDVFSDIRSESTATIKACSNEAHDYLDSSILKRAFPERLFALTVTLLFEIPVLIMVSGGSDKLCGLVGRSKYQLLMGFLPLSSAISGNVGLQASTLTTRAVSHEHVTITNYTTWLTKEIGAALYLGLAMGTVLGTIAFFLSNYHFGFGLTVMIAQFVSILTAGLTGTLAPLLFSFIFERDAGKWGGPLETAIQDIIGSFAMVVLSYTILNWFGPFDIDPTDICGGA